MDLNLLRTLLASAMTLVMPGFTNAQVLQRQMLQKPETTDVSIKGVVKNVAQRRANALVTNPQGTYKDYALSLYMYVNKLMPDYDEYDLKNKFVFGDDGHTVWIKDFFMGKQTGWAKGELKNNKITIQAGQYVGDSDNNQLYLFPFTIDDNSNPVLLESVNLVKKNGAWTMEGSTDVYWGLWFYTSEKNISLTSAYGHKQSFREVSMQPVVVPESATHEQYILSFTDGWRNGEERKVVDVARNGDDIYINGLSFDSRSDYAKGVVKGNEAVFASDQALAGNSTYWLKLTGADGVMYGAKESFTFTISSAGNMTLKDGVLCTKYMFDESNFNVASDVKLVKYAGDVPAVPASPYALKYVASETLGNQFTFVMPHKDVDGNELNPDKLFYRVYIDGNPYTFKASKYTALPEDLSLVSYNYYDAYTFNDVYQSKYKLFYLDEDNWSKLEVESVYIVDGTEKVSTEKASVVNPSSGINTIGEGSLAVKVVYTNLLGQQVVRPQAGNVYVKTVTYKNGKKQTSKIVAQ